MSDQLSHQLQQLHDEYASAVNTALAAGEERIAEEIAQEYPDHALRLLTGGAPTAVLSARRPRALSARYRKTIERHLRGPRRRRT